MGSPDHPGPRLRVSSVVFCNSSCPSTSAPRSQPRLRGAAICREGLDSEMIANRARVVLSLPADVIALVTQVNSATWRHSPTSVDQLHRHGAGWNRNTSRLRGSEVDHTLVGTCSGSLIR